MLFNSLDFLIFFPLAVLVYLLIPARFRQIWLLLCSWFFYACWNVRYILLLLASTVITYACARWMEKLEEKRRKRLPLILCILLNLAILFTFKYLDFFLSSVGGLFRTGNVPQFDLLLPVGISFYIFQALGYTIDCYRGDISAEHNFISYALFVSFFPQLVAGPIERSASLLPQIRNLSSLSRKELWDFERIRNGCILIAWGMFMKVVIADRVSVLVDQVYSHYGLYGTVGLMMAVLGFGLQIYCDFGGYSMMAVGAAGVMGIRLMENFRAPYFSTSVTDFWRRWHISLSTWFRDYLYIPLGGNRKGTAKKLLFLLITFTVSGLWHGANWTFVFWGLLHGFLLVIENLLRPLVRRMHAAWNVRTNTAGFRICRACLVTLIVDFAWIFFRADTISDAMTIISRIFTKMDLWVLSGGEIFTYGLDAAECRILMAALLILIIVDILRVRTGLMIDQWLAGQYAGFRIAFVLLIVMLTIVFGQYGPGFDSKQFIYFQF